MKDKKEKNIKKDIAVNVENVSKKFCRTLKRSMIYGFWDITRSMLGIGYPTDYLRKKEFWALEDISFNLKKGDTLGIVGINGSGKSTLLRLITGIYPPDSGIIKIRGRVSALIAVGAGFHPNMSGLENIYLNGSILGMKKKEINKKLQSIIDFADIGDFLDAPVSTYSSGMRVRLGFAIAIHAEPDILLIDEVLAVGDFAFKNKCMRKIVELRKKDTTIIFISHNVEQVRLLCERVIVLDKGKKIFDGKTQEGLVKYESLTRDIRVENLNKEKKFIRPQRSLIDTKDIIVNDIGIYDENDKKIEKIDIDDPLIIKLQFETKKDFEGLIFNLAIVDEKNNNLIRISSDKLKIKSLNDIVKGKYILTIDFNKHSLMPGVYSFNYSIVNAKTLEKYNQIFSDLVFQITTENKLEDLGSLNVNNNWKLKKV